MSKDQRFKKANSKNFRNVVPPVNLLHFSNLSEKVDAHFFIKLINQISKVKAFQYFKTDNKMSIAEFFSANDAVAVLVTLHNYNIYGRF